MNADKTMCYPRSWRACISREACQHVHRSRSPGSTWQHGCSAGEIAIAWTLKHPAVTAAIVGMRSPERAQGVLAEVTGDWPEGRIIGRR